MRNILYASICLFLLNSYHQKADAQVLETRYRSFGTLITNDASVDASSMASQYKTMQVGDTLQTKMIAKVKSVCKAKGCWMRLDLEDGNEVMIKFKDYGFFMPKDISGHSVVVNGKAFVEEISVEEQRHYAEDAGKTPEEIASIIKPKRTWSFEADGVLLKQ